ncbi:MAG TPA: hypothetical protein VFN08_12170 [Gemmatimonadales bacterium]|nr:hypothetical protein [Gemmatimonadales bacterium]
MRHAHVLVAVFLLTECRFQEVAGLELEDVSFDRKTITVRPNRWRRLETRTSHRVIPLWPQLEAILRAWVFGPLLERGPYWCPPGPLEALRSLSATSTSYWIVSRPGRVSPRANSAPTRSGTPTAPGGSRRWTTGRQ